MNEAVEVLLNVYDIQQKSTLVRLNNVTRDLGIGGIFHGAIQLGGAEFSFGWCESGTGVYAVHPKQNPMYQFRETISLGHTSKSLEEIKNIIQQLKTTWTGSSYDLLNRNCCHFCCALAEELGVAPVPGWLNRFASGAAATVSLTQETVKTMHDIGAELSRLSGESLVFLRSSWSKTVAAATQQQQQLAGRIQQQQQRIRTQRESGATEDMPSQLHDDVQQQSYSSSSSSRNMNRRLGSGGSGGSSNFSVTAAAAGASLLSGMNQLKASTSKLLAQAAAAKGPAAADSQASAAGGTQQHGYHAVGSADQQHYGNSSSSSNRATSWQQQQQPGDQWHSSHPNQLQGAEQQQQPADGDGDGGAAAAAGLVPGAQPKLARQYCLSSRSRQQGDNSDEEDPLERMASLLLGDDNADATAEQQHQHGQKHNRKPEQQGQHLDLL